MLQPAKFIGLGIASLALTSASPAPPRLSPEAMRLLDPSAVAAEACGGARNNSLRQNLRFAMAMMQAQPAEQQPDQPVDEPVPLIEGLGDIHFAVTTKSETAQRYFDQGLALAYAFNHAEAIRAFKAAQKLDPDCAMCWWGEAYAYGPNINAPMDPQVMAQAYEAAQRAMQLRQNAAPQEQALIEAMAARYSNDPAADRAQLDRDFAAAMLAVAGRFPRDDDIAVLTAESIMDTQPWDYWEADKRTPKGQIGDAIRLVEAVLARDPDHPQASHLYIHLVEASATPERAEPYADRLAKPLMPGAGHMLHMPAHLYYRVGRYEDSIRVNREAMRVDEDYLQKSTETGLYRYGYYPHNIHFIVTSAQMAGDKNTALEAAQKLGTVLNTDISANMPWVQPVDAAPYLAYAQFGTPDEIMGLSPPDERLPYAMALWHYARATAAAQQRDATGVERELEALRRIRETTDFKPMVDQNVPAPDLLRLADLVARGRLAYAQGDFRQAAQHYREAAAIEDGLRYMEPPFWYYPVRQSLGGALFRMGDFEGARAAFMGALTAAPNNGWALYGLAETQRAMGDETGAAATTAVLDRAWIGDRDWLNMDRL